MFVCLSVCVTLSGRAWFIVFGVVCGVQWNRGIEVGVSNRTRISESFSWYRKELRTLVHTCYYSHRYLDLYLYIVVSYSLPVNCDLTS